MPTQAPSERAEIRSVGCLVVLASMRVGCAEIARTKVAHPLILRGSRSIQPEVALVPRLDLSVCVLSKASRVALVNGLLGVPRPAAKLSVSIVTNSLGELIL